MLLRNKRSLESVYPSFFLELTLCGAELNIPQDVINLVYKAITVPWVNYHHVIQRFRNVYNQFLKKNLKGHRFNRKYKREEGQEAAIARIQPR